MTALIKSTDGSGWVEARVGDVVDIDCPDLRIRSVVIAGLDGDKVLFMRGGAPSVSSLASKCQLIERPFQVVDVVCGGNLHFDSDDYTGIIVEIGDRIKVKCGDTYFISDEKSWRHSSPLLRPVGDV